MNALQLTLDVDEPPCTRHGTRGCWAPRCQTLDRANGHASREPQISAPMARPYYTPEPDWHGLEDELAAMRAGDRYDPGPRERPDPGDLRISPAERRRERERYERGLDDQGRGDVGEGDW